MPVSIRDRVARINARLRRPGWFLLAFLALNGARVTDFATFRVLTADPFALHPELERQFLHGSPFTFFLGAPVAALLGTAVAWGLVTAGGLAFVVVALRRTLRRFPADQAATVCLVLASTPLLLVLTRWIGKSDPYLVGFYLLLAADPSRRAVRTALAVAMVLCHREVGSVVLLVHLLCARRDATPILVGLAIGHGLLLGYFHLLLPAPPQTRAQFAAHRAGEIFGSVAASPLVHLAGALNWFWILFLAQVRRARELLAMAAILAVAAAALDFTRVVVLCALPVILHAAVRVAADAALAARLRRAAFVPLLFVVQFQIENGGRVHDWSWLR